MIKYIEAQTKTVQYGKIVFSTGVHIVAERENGYRDYVQNIIENN